MKAIIFSLSCPGSATLTRGRAKSRAALTLPLSIFLQSLFSSGSSRRRRRRGDYYGVAAFSKCLPLLRQYRTIRVRVLARDFCACFQEARFDPLHALRRIFLRRFPRRKLAISLILLRFLSENRQRNLSPYCAQGSSGASLEKSQENRRFLGFVP